MNEHSLQNQIRLTCSPYAILFRINVGSGVTYDGRHFSTGVPPGYTDLSGYRKSDGKAVFIEVKTPNGRVRPEQENFIRIAKSYGALAGIARSIDDALKILEVK